MRSSHDPAMNRSPCRCFSLRAGIGITSYSVHLRAPIGSHIQNVSVDPIQLCYRMERPAISMEGGKAYGAALPAAVCEAFEKRIDTMINPRRILCADFDEKRLMVKSIL